MNSKRIVFFPRYTADAPLSRYRSYTLKNDLEKNGFIYQLYPFYSAIASRRWYEKGKKSTRFSAFFASLKRLWHLFFLKANDIVVIEYPLLKGISYRFQKWLLRKQKHIVTDLIYLSSFAGSDKEREAFLSSSDIVITPDIVTTKRVLVIAKELIAISPCVSISDYASALPANVPGAEKNAFRIGWMGTTATTHHLLLIKDCLLQLHDLYNIRLVLIGFDRKRETELQGLPYTIHARNADNEISVLKTCDAGILPLPEAHTSVEATSFPMIQYIACGLPVVAASNEITIAINHSNDNLFARTIFEWYSCLATMIQSREYYKAVGEKNKAIATDFYSVERAQKDYLSGIQNLMDKE